MGTTLGMQDAWHTMKCKTVLTLRGLNIEREILNAARSSLSYHAGVAMATHPVKPHREETGRKKGKRKKAGTFVQA